MSEQAQPLERRLKYIFVTWTDDKGRRDNNRWENSLTLSIPIFDQEFAFRQYTAAECMSYIWAVSNAGSYLSI